ncbi:MAG: bacteriocin immunity protein [Pantoea sp.]|uniref:bacteriocin immunity protein n=1 Tax=Pantoea sp. TaxID=69393 RepID=UPI002384DCF6|nr:bacteriocin immunity protein [Pantoea sp.]MDE1186591.1 bacteriocin immunity protein [Pantoea sp.]
MELKNKYEDYTEAEFTQLVTEIFTVEGSEAYQDELLENFIAVSEHPNGSDLIYYNQDENITPRKVVEEIKNWRADNNKSSFRS